VRLFRVEVDVRTVSKAFDTVPERTTDCAHAESTTEIVQGPVVGVWLAGWSDAEGRELNIHPRARVSAVIHGECEMCVVVVEVEDRTAVWTSVVDWPPPATFRRR
jgi:hypothetical protein